MASAWGKPGAWAQDVEETETALQNKPKTAADDNNEGDFPSLAMAAAAPKTKKSKNKTGTKLSLAEFTTGAYVAPNAKSRQAAEIKGLTPDEMLMLPTGPRERTAEELERERSGGLGGGFRSYGGDRDRDRDRERRREPVFDSDEPSRADSSSHWGSSKLSSSSASSFGRDRDRDGASSFGKDRDRDGPSRADETEDWVAGKKFMPSSDRKFGDGFGGGGGGGGGFGELGQSRADESSNWGAQKQFSSGRGFESYSTRRGGGGGGRSGFDFFGGGGSDGDRWSKRDENNGGGGGRPRLVLQPRTAPIEGAANSSSLSLGESGAKPRASNPFGEAKPREQVLEEKGMDWKKLDQDLELRGKKDADLGTRSSNTQADDRTERDWRKMNNNANGRRAEETLRASSGDDSSHNEFKHLETLSNESDESDDSGLVKNEKVEQLGNDLSQKSHVSQENGNGNGNGNNRIGRW